MDSETVFILRGNGIIIKVCCLSVSLLVSNVVSWKKLLSCCCETCRKESQRLWHDPVRFWTNLSQYQYRSANICKSRASTVGLARVDRGHCCILVGSGALQACITKMTVTRETCWCGRTRRWSLMWENSEMINDVGELGDDQWCGRTPRWSMMWENSEMINDVGELRDDHWCGRTRRWSLMWENSEMIIDVGELRDDQCCHCWASARNDGLSNCRHWRKVCTETFGAYPQPGHIVFSTCLSVRLFVRSSVDKLVNIIFWKRMNLLWCQWHTWSRFTGRGYQPVNFGRQQWCSPWGLEGPRLGLGLGLEGWGLDLGLDVVLEASRSRPWS